jgi:hypothetical protein
MEQKSQEIVRSAGLEGELRPTMALPSHRRVSQPSRRQEFSISASPPYHVGTGEDLSRVASLTGFAHNLRREYNVEIAACVNVPPKSVAKAAVFVTENPAMTSISQLFSLRSSTSR